MRRRLLLALVASAALACGPGPTVPSPFANHAAVLTLLEQIVETMQEQSFRRNLIDWTRFRADVFAKAANADNMTEAAPAIQLAFQLLNDPHSRYAAANGTTIRYSTLDCSAPVPHVLPPTPGIGYVWVGATSGSTAEAYAGAMHATIRAADSDDTFGWIVDLRGNGGGSTYGMVAGIGPILGDGVAGAFVTLDGVKTEWGYRSGASNATGATSNGSLVVVPSTVYQLRRPNPRVAVLSDRANASAGESTLISFIGRPDTRVFGTASCGLSQGVAGLPMQDGATLWLARSIMSDRNGRAYGSTIAVDETISDEAQLFARAIEWLKTGR